MCHWFKKTWFIQSGSIEMRLIRPFVGPAGSSATHIGDKTSEKPGLLMKRKC